MADAPHPDLADDQRPRKEPVGGPEPVAGHLRSVDAEHAEFANQLHRLITSDPGLTVLRGWHHRQPKGRVFCDHSGLLWFPSDSDREVGGDLDTQMELLVEYEAVLSAFERATGLAFEPEAVTEGWPAEAYWVELGFDGRRCVVGFVPKLVDTANLEAPTSHAAPSLTPVRASLAFRVATEPLEQVEALSSGALLCFPAGPVRAVLASAVSARGCTGRYDFKSGILHGASHEGVHAMSEPKRDGTASGLKVPLTIRLPEISVPVAEIEALAQGGTVTLTPLEEGLAADLLVSGQVIATGEIVRLGDSFAFLVDAMSAPPREPAEEAPGQMPPPVPPQAGGQP